MAPADTLALPVITVHGVPSEPGTSRNRASMNALWQLL